MQLELKREGKIFLGFLGASFFFATWAFLVSNPDMFKRVYCANVLARTQEGDGQQCIAYMGTDAGIATLKKATTVRYLASLPPDEQTYDTWIATLNRARALVHCDGTDALVHMLAEDVKLHNSNIWCGGKTLSWAFFWNDSAKDDEVVKFSIASWPQASHDEKIQLGIWSHRVTPEFDGALHPHYFNRYLEYSKAAFLPYPNGAFTPDQDFVDPARVGSVSLGQDVSGVQKWADGNDPDKRRFAYRFISGQTPAIPGEEKCAAMFRKGQTDPDPVIREISKRWVSKRKSP